MILPSVVSVTRRSSQQSGHGRNAGPATRFDAGTEKALTPQCGGDSLNGLAVPTFGDPPEVDAGAGTQFVDETLTFDADFINDTNYTIFVVERRSADHFQWLVGQDRSAAPGTMFLSCGISDQEDALGFGFEELAGPALAYSQVCSGGAGSGSGKHRRDRHLQRSPDGPGATIDRGVFEAPMGASLLTAVHFDIYMSI